MATIEAESLALTTADGVVLPARLWPAPVPRAVLALVHGLGEHCARYARFAKLAAQRGVSVLAVDLRGHGAAPGEPGWIESFDDFLCDVDALIACAARQGAPLFLMGHSLGGAIALRWLDRRREAASTLRGFVSSSAALQVGDDVHPVLLALAPLVAWLAPWARLQGIDPVLISRDAGEVAAYRNDPLIAHRPPPARTANELLKVLAKNLAAATTLNLPLLALHGTADRLTNPAGTRALHAAWRGGDKTLSLWPGGYHELLNDLDADAVMACILDWVLARA